MIAFRVMVARLIALTALVAVPALAGPPSERCREGATVCRDAYIKLEECEQKNHGDPEACATERKEADLWCMETTSACHTDGSRARP